MIWKALCFSKLKCSHGFKKLNTNDLIHKQTSNCILLLLLQWCIICRRDEETIDHLLLHCPMALLLWHQLFSIVGMDWVVHSCVQMLQIDFRGLGSMELCSLCGLLDDLVAKTVNDKFYDLGGLWDLVCYLSSFWVPVSPPFKELHLFFICSDWGAICDF